MSRLYFHTREATAELMGTEAHWLRSIAFDTGCAPLHDMSAEFALRLHGLLPIGHWLKSHPVGSGFGRNYQTALRAALDGTVVEFEGRSIDSFALILNTALALGNDVVKLATRLHAQCEIHGWVAGSDRAWMADLIDHGLEVGTLRRTIQPHGEGPNAPAIAQGWEEVTALLRSTDSGPAVLSYSVTSGFPDPRIAGLYICDGDPDDPYAVWKELTPDQQWDAAFAKLAAEPGGLRIGPDNLSARFDHGLSLLDLQADDWADHARKALSLMNMDDSAPGGGAEK